MNNIDVISLIKKDNLDQKNYFKTLINEAYNIGILNDADILDIQTQLLKLLDKIVYKYNGTESSSIRKEILEEISNSNIYIIEIYLKTFNYPDDAVRTIKDKGINFIYLEGRKRIEKLLNVIRVYYIKIKENKLNLENMIYEDTILGGIKGFLKIYDPDFDAQDMKITADYPLFNNNYIRNLQGVEFVEKYVKSLYLENKFCKMFSEEKIKYLLSGYSTRYKELIINIFEIVLLEIYACKLVNKNVQNLIITKEELNKIYDILENKTEQEIKDKLQNLYIDIKKELLVKDIEIQNYIETNLDYIFKLIYNSFKQKTLDKIFITEKYIIS